MVSPKKSKSSRPRSQLGCEYGPAQIRATPKTAVMPFAKLIDEPFPMVTPVTGDRTIQSTNVLEGPWTPEMSWPFLHVPITSSVGKVTAMLRRHVSVLAASITQRSLFYMDRNN